MQRGMHDFRQILCEAFIMTPNVTSGKRIHGIE